MKTQSSTYRQANITRQTKKRRDRRDLGKMSRYSRVDTEAGAQEMLFNWMQLQSGRYPELNLAYHVPNGGKRNSAEAAHLKRQGVKAGVPDICLPVARRGYHGLYIELKVGRNKPTQNQKNWIILLQEQGYKAVVCWGWEEAAEVIGEYVGMEKQKII